MNFVELFEGTTPKLPGAVGGIKVMSMDQFLAQSDESPDEQLDELSPQTLASYVRKSNTDARDRLKQDPNNQFKKAQKRAAGIGQAIGKIRATMEPSTAKQQNVVEGPALSTSTLTGEIPTLMGLRKKEQGDLIEKYALWSREKDYFELFVELSGKPMPEIYNMNDSHQLAYELYNLGSQIASDWHNISNPKFSRREYLNQIMSDWYNLFKKSIQKYKSMKQGVAEATKLPAQTRELKGQELDDYLDRIRNREKGKTDKYKLPYIHRSSVVKYYNEEGKRYDTDQIKTALGVRPKKLLKQNEKMKHSNGELEQFYNIGFAALVGIALDEGTNELIVVNTCPGAGSCKVDCFAMKGGKVQFEGPWLSDGRILTFLLNDPDGFFNQLSAEITKEEKLAKKGGYKVSIRWHDAGDFFSPEYQDLAFKLAEKFPEWAVFSDGKLTFGFDEKSASAKAESLRDQDPKAKAVPVVGFYAYTKIADAALGQKPANFIVNWSEGASTSQEKQVKAQDPQLDVTKNSRIVPSKLFYDLLKKDEKGNLDKTADGAWQPRDSAALEELKDRLAQQYNLKRDSIIDYNEMMATPQKNNIKKWNVIIAPGEGDISANRQDVLSTLLLKH